MSVSDYLRLQYPKVLFCHIANERQTTPKRGAKLKRMGVRSGMPDVMIFQYKINKDTGKLTSVGLAIELKIKPNKPSKNQLEVLEQLNKQGWATHICYDFDKAKSIIDNYLK